MRKKRSFHIVLKIVVMLILSVMLNVEAHATQRIYTFDPAAQDYEYYPGSLNLWSTDQTGFSRLTAAVNDGGDASVIRTWLAMIMSAQAMGKKILVTYDDATGRLFSVYGPK